MQAGRGGAALGVLPVLVVRELDQPRAREQMVGEAVAVELS